MAGRICHSPEDAFRAGWEEPCDHAFPEPADCPQCGLTDAEIASLAVLLRGTVTPGRIPEQGPTERAAA